MKSRERTTNMTIQKVGKVGKVEIVQQVGKQKDEIIGKGWKVKK